MSRRITRRAAARLLVAGPAALALPSMLQADPVREKRVAKLVLSPSERREFDKAVTQLRTTAGKLRKVAVPMGTEPAFVFRPILPKK